jgi:hypothetical protein
MPEMAEVIDGHPADVHPHPRRIDRCEGFFRPAEAVVDFQHGTGSAAAGEKSDKIEEIPARG